jgi:hypothetical protein
MRRFRAHSQRDSPAAAAGSSRTAAPIAAGAIVARASGRCDEGAGGGHTMTPLPITLAAAAAAVFVNIWLGSRIVKTRRDNGVKICDGGNEAVLRRMRAQANFIENAPFFLILLGGLEVSGGNRPGPGRNRDPVRPRPNRTPDRNGRPSGLALENGRDDDHRPLDCCTRFLGDHLRGPDAARRLGPHRSRTGWSAARGRRSTSVHGPERTRYRRPSATASS